LSLFTKAIDKVEGEQKKDAPLPMLPGPRSKKKLWFILALVILLLGLGSGYLLFFRSTPPTPTKAKPRSAIVKRKPIQKDVLAKTGLAQPKDSTATVIPPTGEERPKEDSKKPLQAPAVENKVSRVTKTTRPAQITIENENHTQITVVDQENTKNIKSPKPEASGEAKLSDAAEENESKKKSLEGYPGYAEPEAETKTELSLPAPKEEERKESPPLPSSTKGKTPQPPTSSTEKGSALESMTATASKSKEGGTYRVPEVADRSVSRAQTYYKKGISYQQERKFTEALDSYQKALILDPEHEQARMNLASVLMQTGRFKEAEEQLILLHALRPKDQKILFNMGLLLIKLGQYPSAEEKLEQLLKINPFHLEACLLLASVYEEKGDMSKALEFYRQAYHIDTQSPAALYQLARALDISGDWNQAAEFYQLYLESNSGKDGELELAVHERLNYLLMQKEKK
jgi:tetratricopeptide (TPR) repeat protein